MRKTIVLTAGIVLGTLGSLFAQGDALIRPGDAFDLRISGVPSDDSGLISSNYTVDGQGYMNLSYIGKVKVAGKSASEAQSLVEHMYVTEGIFTHPTVSINIAPTARFVNVGGPGVKAGVRVPFTADMTLMSAILAAGDFNDFADQKHVNLIRGSKVTIVNCKEVRRNPSKDVAVLPGDTIQVPQTPF